MGLEAVARESVYAEMIKWNDLVRVQELGDATPRPTMTPKDRRALAGSRVERISRIELSAKPFSAEEKLRTFSEIVAAATRKYLDNGANWRSDRNVRRRTIAAWAFNALVYFTVAVLTLTHGSKFTANSTNEMLTVWLLAMLQIYLIVEPIQILVMVSIPLVCDQKTDRGRCCAVVKFCWHELC